MLDDILEFLSFIWPLLALITAVMAIIIAIAYPLDAYTCKKLGENTNRKSEYHFIGGGCLIEVNGELVPKSVWVNNEGN